jgi:hypothetical protein
MGFAAWKIDVLEIKHAVISNAKFSSGSRDAVMRFYGEAGNVIDFLIQKRVFARVFTALHIAADAR